MEHRFISLKDSFVHCIAICRQRILNCSTEDIMMTLLAIPSEPSSALKKPSSSSSSTTNNQQNGTHDITSGIDTIENGDVNIKLKPEMPLDIAKWMEYNEISSKNLRNGC